MHCCVVIPAYEPGIELLPYLDALLPRLPGPLVLVDDGSGPDYAGVFTKAAQKPGCLVRRHPHNRGKGAALKTAIRFILEQDIAGAGVVTADCDGQHSVEDVLAVCAALCRNDDALVLGSRVFDENTPKRSRTGNRVTSAAMGLLYGIHLQDTQTGLRGLPVTRLPALAGLKGDRYEYELNMLIWAKQQSIPVVQVPIQTIYYDNNNGSHYRTVADSARLVGQLAKGLVRFGMSAALAGVVDFGLYTLLVKLVLSGWPLTDRLLWAAVAARVASSFVNYAANRRLPTTQDKKLGPTLIRYYALWCFQLLASLALVWVLVVGLGAGELAAKLLVDGLLGLASYQVQMRWVFKKRPGPHPVRIGKEVDRL